MKARIAVVFAVLVALAGALSALSFVALLIVQLAASIEVRSWIALPMSLLFADHATLQNAKVAPLLALIPELRWGWTPQPAAAWVLDRLHVGLPLLLGLALVAWGMQRVMLQMALTRAYQQQREDRTRRIQDYLQDGPIDGFEGRREPFIGNPRANRRVA